MTRTAAFCLLLSVGIGTAEAASMGSPDQGKDIAQRWCASCHDISGKSPKMTEAPSFVSVAGKSETTAAGLRAFLHTPHSTMPDLSLNREETDHLIAYILGLKKR